MSLAGRVFSNRYELQREIARGGMAEVYLARDQLLDRPVALKVLASEYAREPSFVERFRREAQAAANLNHPNIVGIYDWGQESGTYFIVMEYVEGRSLRELIRAGGPVAPEVIADVGAAIAAALAEAHAQGVVHRDVKPGNVLITNAGTVKVTDFGIASRGTSDGLTQTGNVMGTATYFSPEQAQGLPVDGRSDIYSLGVVLYEMATGVPPFSGDSPVSVAYKHVKEPPVPPRQRVPAIPEDLERVILTAMAKDPASRYQSAADLRADLQRFRRGRPVEGAAVTAAVVSELPTAAVAATQVGTAVASDRTAVTTAYEEPAKRRGPLAAIITILVLLLLVGGGLLLAQLLGNDEGTAEVPTVVGQNVDEATRSLEDAGFKVEVEPVTDPNAPEGQVVDQRPAGGTQLTKGRTVTLRVSSGATQVPVPTVTNLDLGAAQRLLQDQGFQVEVRPEANDTVPEGGVIGTDPPAGTQVGQGSRVFLLVSSGPGDARVPDVDGDSESSAAAALGEAGFRVRTTREASNDVDAGNVIRTEPAGGSTAPRGSSVTMVVSSGPSTATVPSVVGKTEAQAAADLTRAGFDVRVVEAPSDAANVGRVIAQDPAGNTQAAPGSAVAITVGRPAPTTTTTTTAPPTTTTTTASP